MTALQAQPILTPKDYLQSERSAETRHEYIAGEIYAMASASRKHNLIVANLVRILGNTLLDKPCHVYPSDMKVYIEQTEKFTYPDVTVSCGEEQFFDEEDDVLLNPLLLIEVLSKSTEAYDRGKKFFYYRQIPSFREYLLVAQDRYSVEHYALQDNGHWHYYSHHHHDDIVHLQQVAATLSVQDIYHKLKF